MLLDILTEDPEWSSWSERALEGVAGEGPLLPNQVVYAEVSIRFERIEELDQALAEPAFSPGLLAVTRGLLSRQGLPRLSPPRWRPTLAPPDFYIGAHAAISDLTLLTRDASRYRTYFPRLRLIAPG